MTAIYKRELKSYLTSMVGYLFIFFILVLTGIYFSAYQLSAAYPKFEYTLSAITFAFLIGVPILTMRVLAEERKQKTDQLLLTAPVSVSGIVISCTGNCICCSDGSYVYLSADYVQVWHSRVCICIYSSPGILSPGMCKYCNRCIYVSIN